MAYESMFTASQKHGGPQAAPVARLDAVAPPAPKGPSQDLDLEHDVKQKPSPNPFLAPQGP
jgi:hypothetical protein